MDAEFSWAVGLFEGEGCILHSRYRRSSSGAMRTRRALALASTDRDVVERFVAAVGVGAVRGPFRQRRGKPMWRWDLHAWADVEPLLKRMLPLLCTRRAEKARALLADPARALKPATVT